MLGFKSNKAPYNSTGFVIFSNSMDSLHFYKTGWCRRECIWWYFSVLCYISVITCCSDVRNSSVSRSPRERPSSSYSHASFYVFAIIITLTYKNVHYLVDDSISFLATIQEMTQVRSFTIILIADILLL